MFGRPATRCFETVARMWGGVLFRQVFWKVFGGWREERVIETVLNNIMLYVCVYPIKACEHTYLKPLIRIKKCRFKNRCPGM